MKNADMQDRSSAAITAPSLEYPTFHRSIRRKPTCPAAGTTCFFFSSSFRHPLPHPLAREPGGMDAGAARALAKMRELLCEAFTE